ncbi:MAG: hypothetical protein V4480_03080 [Patescibacteria group bacterium]
MPQKAKANMLFGDRHATQRMYEDFPWLWAIFSHYRPGDVIKVKELENELEEPAPYGLYLVIDRTQDWIDVKHLEGPGQHDPDEYMLNRILWNDREHIDGRKVKYVVRRNGDDSVTILKPPKGRTIIEVAHQLRNAMRASKEQV